MCILIRMGKNYTLYIRHEQFSKESNKSGTVNTLLDEHYKKIAEQKEKLAKAGIRSTTVSEMDLQTHTLKTTIIPDKKDLIKFQKEVHLLNSEEPTYEPFDEIA